jgi:hypothetical protein
MAILWSVSLLVLTLCQGSSETPYVAEVTGGPVHLLSGADERFPTVTQANSGDLLVVVDEQSGWARVQVPTGFSGWVHGRYVTTTSPGHGTVNASEVNFRVQPSSTVNNLPIGTLNKGAEVFILGRQEDWLHVSAPPELTLWVPTKDLKRAGDVEAFTPKLRELRDGAEKGWVAAAGSAAPAEAPAAAAANAAMITAARESVTKAKTDPTVDLSKTTADLKGIASGTGSDADKKAASDLIADIESVEKARRDTALKATEKPSTPAPSPEDARTAAAKTTKPVPQATLVSSPLAPASGSKFAAVGWVSASRDPKAIAYLRKGGVVTFRLSCPDGRYRLSDFADREIGVTGKIVAAEGLQPMVEVESVEILRK